VASYFVLSSPIAHNAYFAMFNIVAVVAIISGIRLHRPIDAVPWSLFAAGLLFWSLGEFTWAGYNIVLGAEAPFPSIADALFLAYYPCISAGLLVLVRARSGPWNRASQLDALIVTISLGLLSWIFVFAPNLVDTSLTTGQRLTPISYPLMDILLLAVASRLLFAPGVRSLAYLLVGASLVITLVSDALWSATLLTKTYYAGHPLTLGWLLVLVTWGAAALHPSMAMMRM